MVQVHSEHGQLSSPSSRLSLSVSPSVSIVRPSRASLTLSTGTLRSQASWDIVITDGCLGTWTGIQRSSDPCLWSSSGQSHLSLEGLVSVQFPHHLPLWAVQDKDS